MIRVLHRAIEILECFDLDRPSLTLHELAQRSGLPKTTAFRVIMTLLDAGYLLQAGSGEYSLSPKLMRLAAIAQKTFDIRDVVRPFLKGLALATGETMDLHVVSGRGRMCIDAIESSQSIKRVIGLGEYAPLPKGASGKVLLAFGDEALQDGIVAELDAKARRELLQECVLIRQQGYAFSHGERVEGASALAVPLREHTGPVRYCITIAGPSFRFDDRKEEFAALMLEAGSAISEQLGGALAIGARPDAENVGLGKEESQFQKPLKKPRKQPS